MLSLILGMTLSLANAQACPNAKAQNTEANVDQVSQTLAQADASAVPAAGAATEGASCGKEGCSSCEQCKSCGKSGGDCACTHAKKDKSKKHAGCECSASCGAHKKAKT